MPSITDADSVWFVPNEAVGRRAEYRCRTIYCLKVLSGISDNVQRLTKQPVSANLAKGRLKNRRVEILIFE